MTLSITLPDDLARKLARRWSDLPRHVLETIVVDAYRQGLISGGQLQRILGIPSRYGVHGFLKSQGVYLNYDEGALDQDLEASGRLAGS